MYQLFPSDEINISKIQILTRTSVLEIDFYSTEALWLDSILKSLGYILGISIHIIMGLSSLFICKRGLNHWRFHNKLDTFGQYFYNSHKNVERLADVVQLSGNSESIFWWVGTSHRKCEMCAYIILAIIFICKHMKIGLTVWFF